MDQAILRCCDVVSGLEAAVNHHYLRLNFDFSPTPPASNPNRVKNSVKATDFQSYSNDGVAGVVKRWNGPDGSLNKGKVMLAPQDGGALRVFPIWFAQVIPHPLTAPFNFPDAQYRIEIWGDGRAFMNSTQGTGEIRQGENKPDSDGAFTLAHECGHGDSMADEYVERSNDCSYLQPGYREYVPGAPYNADDRAIMRGNVEPRNRHYWHSAEWLRTLFTTPFEVQYDGFTYRLPPHPNAPRQTFVTDAFASATDVRSGTGNAGFYTCFLYRLGSEHYSVNVLDHGPFDGYLSVNLRLKCSFLDKKGALITDHSKLLDLCAKLVQGAQESLNSKFFGAGVVNGVTFQRCRIAFLPRLLVMNNSNNAKYLAGLHNPNNLPYPQLVTNIENTLGPTHYNVSFTQRGPTSIVAPGAAGPGTLTFNMDDLDLEDDFPIWFAGMLGVNVAKGAMKQPNNYLPIVQQVIPNGTVSALPK
jgi:hypothetical protein